jgi:hypothetical protein
LAGFFFVRIGQLASGHLHRANRLNATAVSWIACRRGATMWLLKGDLEQIPRFAERSLDDVHLVQVVSQLAGVLTSCRGTVDEFLHPLDATLPVRDALDDCG